MAHSSNATKYEELRAEFLQAAAEFDHLHFRLSIESSKASEESNIRHGRYDIPCHTEWPYPPWRECAVLVPCDGEMEEPYSRLKALSASAWLWLPEDIAEALGEWIPKVDANCMRMHFQPWIWLLWVRDFVEGREPEPEPPGCAGVDMDPFVASASLIRDWRLNSDKPTAPACLYWGAKATHLDALETVLNELDSWKDYVKSDTSEECFPEAIEDDKTPGREPHPLWLAVENLRKHYRRQPPPTLTAAIDAWNDLRDNSRQRGDGNRIEQRDKAIDAANRLREWVAGEIEGIGSYEPGTEEEESKPKVGEHEEVERSKPAVSGKTTRTDDDEGPKAIKRPSENAFKVWRLRDATGNNQTELAEKMTKNGVPTNQGQVSKWLKQVKQYLADGNVLPELPTRGKVDSVDPKVIDMGKRPDGRSPHQRERWDATE